MRNFEYPLRKWSGADKPRMMRKAKPRVMGTPLKPAAGAIPPAGALDGMLKAYREAKAKGLKVDAIRDMLIKQGCKASAL